MAIGTFCCPTQTVAPPLIVLENTFLADTCDGMAQHELINYILIIEPMQMTLFVHELMYLSPKGYLKSSAAATK